ncbi:MAG: cellulose biosynthesis protein BcsS, partial [Hyphomicrobium sp.]
VKLGLEGLMLLGAAAIFATAPALAEDSGARHGTAVSTESTYKDDYSFSTGTAIHAINRDLSRDGFLLRAFAGIGDYQYRADALRRGHVETDLTIFDLGAGYQHIAGNLRLAAFASASYEDHDQSPEDTRNPVRDDEWGFKARLEAETTSASPFYAGLVGEYGTAFESYYVRGRVGVDICKGIVLGPEIAALGDEAYDQVRYGAFVAGLPSLMSLLIGGNSKTTLSVGYADTSDDESDVIGRGGEDSVYGTMSSTFKF